MLTEGTKYLVDVRHKPVVDYALILQSLDFIATLLPLLMNLVLLRPNK